ncbi:MAG: hypothetical protein AAF401_10955 [Pseudomonadota bacterium]
MIPAAADGAVRLIDALAALPAFSAPAAIAALNEAEGERVTIWRRAPGAAGAALALNARPT